MVRQAIAREIMSRPVITVSPDTPFRDIVTIMLRHKISGLPVVDEHGRLLGVATEADLLHKEEAPHPQPALIPWHGSSLRLERILDRHRKSEAMTAGELMTENVVTATEETSVHELAHQFAHVADHQHRAPHPEGHQVVQDVGEDGFSGDVEQHLGLGVRVGAQPGAHARGRDDRDRLTRHAYVPGPRGDA